MPDAPDPIKHTECEFINFSTILRTIVVSSIDKLSFKILAENSNTFSHILSTEVFLSKKKSSIIFSLALFCIVVSMLSNTDFESFQFLLYLLHIIELTHGRVAETSYIREEKLITLEHLYELEGIFLERTKKFLTKTNLLDWKESRRASFLWEFIEKESYIDYMNETLSDTFSVPKYMSIKANEWSGSDGSRGYTFDDKSYTNFIDDATIINTINSVRFSDSFWALDERAIETSAAFILNATNTMRNFEVKIPLINEIIDKWKKEFTEQATQ